jgi:putative flippase GtrA
MIDVAGVDRYSGRVISFLAAATFTWWGNRYFTFSDRRARGFAGALREWGRFILANAVGGLVNVGLYATLVKFAPPPLDNPFLALPFGVAAGLVFNFFFSRQLVFREPPAA